MQEKEMYDIIGSMEGIKNMKRRILDDAKRTLHSASQSDLVEDVQWETDGMLWIDSITTMQSRASTKHAMHTHPFAKSSRLLS